MFLSPFHISPDMSASDVVKQHHRTADVFRKYDIAYCCTGRWPLSTVCAMQGLEFENLKAALEKAVHPHQLPPGLSFENWDIDFLTRYITHIHHHYAKATLPDTAMLLQEFAEGHTKKYPHMMEVSGLCNTLQKELLPHLQHEEEIIFPYISQIYRASRNNDSYGKLLVKPLRKPLDLLHHEKEIFLSVIAKMRLLTHQYTAPEKACVNHMVVMAKLKELDTDLVQHIHLENNILFPKAIQIEKELLQQQ
ncbi:MAG: DUF542 domain-containing protein [Agriterribacter sp.]